MMLFKNISLQKSWNSDYFKMALFIESRISGSSVASKISIVASVHINTIELAPENSYADLAIRYFPLICTYYLLICIYKNMVQTLWYLADQILLCRYRIYYTLIIDSFSEYLHARYLVLSIFGTLSSFKLSVTSISRS